MAEMLGYFSIFQHITDLKITIWLHNDGLELLSKWGATTSQCMTDVNPLHFT